MRVSVIDPPGIPAFEAQLEALSGRILQTPVHPWATPLKDALLGPATSPVFKLELFQRTGTFKLRGALTVLDRLTEEEKSHGVVAATGGNHGIAVAYAAKLAGICAKILVSKTMNPFRRKCLLELGAEVMEYDSFAQAFDAMQEIADRKNRTVMHPFENPWIPLGTGTIGLEFMRQAPGLEAVIIPIGGGGLAAGMACAIKQMDPACKVYGVEPEGANSMRLSLDAGRPVKLPGGAKSIADSLNAPAALPLSFAYCREYLDDVVLVSDMDMRRAMRVLFEDMKLAAEPAAAAATAALLGPLNSRCTGKKTGVIVCGSNIDHKTFCDFLDV